MAAPTEPAHTRTWRVIGVMGLVAMLTGAVSYWIRNSSEVDSAVPVTVPAGESPSTLAPSSGRPPDSVAGTMAMSEPCGFVASGLLDAVRQCTVVKPAPDGGATGRLPLVLFLHGLGGDVSSTISTGGIESAVARYRFVAVVPQGILGSWNAGRCCGLALTSGVDDVTYLRSVIALVSQRDDVDTARIYVAGFSNGGMMAYRLLCDSSDTISAMASVMGTDIAGCSPATPRSVLHVAGKADTTVPYGGGKSVVAAILGVDLPPVEESMVAIAASDGCSSRPTRSREGAGVTRTQWRGCNGDIDVDLLTLDGVDHEWPTGRPIDTTLEVLRFFGIAS